MVFYLRYNLAYSMCMLNMCVRDFMVATDYGHSTNSTCPLVTITVGPNSAAYVSGVGPGLRPGITPIVSRHYPLFGTPHLRVSVSTTRKRRPFRRTVKVVFISSKSPPLDSDDIVQHFLSSQLTRFIQTTAKMIQSDPDDRYTLTNLVTIMIWISIRFDQ
jgi:hypothetical protein